MAVIHSIMRYFGWIPARVVEQHANLRRPDGEFYGEDRLSFRRPMDFDDVESIADLLNEEQPVVVNLELAGPEDKRRIVDFLCGVIYAQHGEVCRVAETVFVFTPNRINIDAPDAELAKRAAGPYAAQPRMARAQAG